MDDVPVSTRDEPLLFTTILDVVNEGIKSTVLHVGVIVQIISIIEQRVRLARFAIARALQIVDKGIYLVFAKIETMTEIECGVEIGARIVVLANTAR